MFTTIIERTVQFSASIPDIIPLLKQDEARLFAEDRKADTPTRLPEQSKVLVGEHPFAQLSSLHDNLYLAAGPLSAQGFTLHDFIETLFSEKIDRVIVAYALETEDMSRNPDYFKRAFEDATFKAVFTQVSVDKHFSGVVHYTYCIENKKTGEKQSGDLEHCWQAKRDYTFDRLETDFELALLQWYVDCTQRGKKTLIHSADGIGRAGMLAFAFWMVAHFDNCLAGKAPNDAAKALIQGLHALRDERQGLLPQSVQWACAIQLGATLVRYYSIKQYAREIKLACRELIRVSPQALVSAIRKACKGQLTLAESTIVTLASDPLNIDMFTQMVYDHTGKAQRQMVGIAPYPNSRVMCGTGVIATAMHEGEVYVCLVESQKAEPWEPPQGFSYFGPYHGDRGIGVYNAGQLDVAEIGRLTGKAAGGGKKPVHSYHQLYHLGLNFRAPLQPTHYDKHPKDTGCRETLEEAGLRLQPEQLKRHDVIFTWNQQRAFFMVTYVYYAILDSLPDLKPDCEEVTSAAWVKASDIEKGLYLGKKVQSKSLPLISQIVRKARDQLITIATDGKVTSIEQLQHCCPDIPVCDSELGKEAYHAHQAHLLRARALKTKPQLGKNSSHFWTGVLAGLATGVTVTVAFSQCLMKRRP